MAYEALEINEMGVTRTVYADDPTLDPNKVYYCSGRGKHGRMCLCPVHLIPGTQLIAPHFRQASQEQRHCSKCTHAEESPYRQIMHLDRSGQDLTAEALLKIGSHDGMDPPSKNKQLPQRGLGNQVQQGQQDDGHEYRPLKVVHKNPTSIQQLYLILSLPDNSVYAGSKTVDLLASSKTIQYHRQHLPMGGGVKLVVAEKDFSRISPRNSDTFFMQDPYWKEGGRKVSEEKRIRYTIQVSAAQRDSINRLLKNAKGKRYLILGDWRYHESTNTYLCVLIKKSHWKALNTKIDCELF